jgi:toxin CptA
MKSALAIGFEYRPSRLLAACLVGVWLFALFALAACGLPAWLKVMLGIATSLYAAWTLRQFLRPSCRHLLWHDAGHWRLSDASGEGHVADLVSAVVRGAWIVLSLRRTDGKRVSVVLAPDNCNADIRRRLRVRLARI